MHRRRFIRSSLGFLLAFAVTQKLSRLSNAVRADATLEEALSHLFTDLENARLIGRAYLERYPQRADVNLLLHTLGPRLSARAAANDGTLLNHLNARRQEDFAAGDTVLVDDWILSRTEASVCALLALT